MRPKTRRLLIIAAVPAIPILVIAVLWVLVDIRIGHLSDALDRDLAALAEKTVNRPPLPGMPEEGSAFDLYRVAFAAVPPDPAGWMDVLKEFQSSGSVSAAALPVLEKAQRSLELVERAARTRRAGLWIDPSTGSDWPGSKIPLVHHLAWLASLDATRLLDAGEIGKAVTRLLAAMRMCGDASRYWDGFIGNRAVWRVLATLVQLSDHLSEQEIRRAVDALSLELSIPTDRPMAPLETLLLQCSYRRALAGVEEELIRFGHIDDRDALGNISFSYYTRSFGGFYERKTCMARVRLWVPDAWEYLRVHTAELESSTTASLRFEREC